MEQHSIKRCVRMLFFSAFLAVTFPTQAFACCTGCTTDDCDEAEQIINDNHQQIQDDTEEHWNSDLEAYQQWLVEVLLGSEVVPAMAAMATQMSAVAMFYTELVGSFLDAQIQMDTQRLLRQLTFEAHKDYRPSEDFCWFGTNVKSLAGSDNRGRFNALALSQLSLKRQVGNMYVAGADHAADDYRSRWERFIQNNCDERDNNYQFLPSVGGGGRGDTGLSLACDANILDANRYNRDIDYTRLIDEPRTIDVDFSNDDLDTTNIIASLHRSLGDEEDVISLSQNLYGHSVLSRELSDSVMKTETAQKLYLMLRSIAAKRSVAQSTFNAIVGLKSSGVPNGGLLTSPLGGLGVHPSGSIYVGELQRTRRFLASIVNELLPGNPDPTGSIPPQAGNIFDLIGYLPSYYSQLEILAKRIYQNPNFYSNLYDTPSNVKRKKIAMKAIELMVDRAMYESQLRREMSISVLLANKLRSSHRDSDRDALLTEER